MSKKTYTVSLTLDTIVADNPLDAVKKAVAIMLEDNDVETMIYDVTDEETNKKFTVDLSEEDVDAVLPNND